MKNRRSNHEACLDAYVKALQRCGVPKSELDRDTLELEHALMSITLCMYGWMINEVRTSDPCSSPCCCLHPPSTPAPTSALGVE